MSKSAEDESREEFEEWFRQASARDVEGLGNILETQHTVLEKTEAALQVDE